MPAPDDTQRIDAIFGRAREIADPTQRAAYLDEACAGDQTLRDEIDSLLVADQAASGFMNLEALPLPKTLTGAKAGDRIGRFKLLEKIGEGGFGEVWMAEQQEPVQRKVALKVIKAGMDTREVIVRFEAERQALALMDHPNIAKVLDGGATEAGRPYFVMELVRGIPITEFCDQKNLSTRERLELFITVCQAVQHAHQKGIIHRDIKPNNVLVSVHDGEPVPKVIDFGVAKALGQKLTEKTLFTAFRQMIGTPAYMSPEQAEMSGLDIDTRSDIYSLGVLLYELLTGVTPFDKETLAKAALDEIRRMIRETEPPKPSTRLRTLGDKVIEIANHRHTEPIALNRLVKGDLDWIAMKCLEKDRQRRYETAFGVASDIERHLNNQPVTAAAPGPVYRAQKLFRRHRTGLVTVGAFLLLLALGAFATAREAVRARSAEREQSRLRQRAEEAGANEARLRRQAQNEEAKAQNEAAKSRQVAGFLEEMLRGVGPSVALGRDTRLLRDILDKTVERLANDLKDQPEVEAELRHTIGGVYRDLGANAKAEQMQRDALVLVRTLFGDIHPMVADCLDGLAAALGAQGKREEAENALHQALSINIRLFGSGTLREADVLYDLAYVLLWEGNLAESEALNTRSLDIRRKLLGSQSLPVASSLNNLALVLQAEGRVAEAEQMLQDSLTITRKILGNDQPDVAMTLFNLAQLQRGKGNYAEAESLHREALEIRRRVLGTEHADFAASVGELQSVLELEGNVNSLARLYTEQVASLRARLSADDPELAAALEQLTVALLTLGRFADAEPAARECLTIRQARLPADWRTFASHTLLGASLQGQKRYADAEAELLSAYEGMWGLRGNLGDDGTRLMRDAAHHLVQLYETTGRADLAAEWQQRETNVQAVIEGAAARGRGLSQAQRGEWKDAAASFAKAVRLDPAEHWNWFQLAVLLADYDPVSYSNHCHAMLGAFSRTTDPWIAERTTKACLLLPPSEADLAVASKLAQTAAAAAKDDPWIHLMLALNEYRGARFTNAAAWAKKALIKAGEKPRRDVGAYMILAMALQRTAQPTPALEAFARGKEIFDTQLPRLEEKDLGPDFQDWFMAKILREEAEYLIPPNTPAGFKPGFTNSLGQPIILRDAGAGSDLLDLSDYYNASLKGNWHGGHPANDLAALGAGVQKLAGVRFDVRGILQVGNGHSPELARFPIQVEGIPVHRKCHRIHFLHSAIYGWNPHGTAVGKYVVHFADGQTADQTIILGEDVVDWWAQLSELAASPKLVPVWEGTNGDSFQQRRRIHLFKSVWENSRPDVEVTTFDFVCARAGDCAPFLVAVTAEP